MPARVVAYRNLTSHPGQSGLSDKRDMRDERSHCSPPLRCGQRVGGVRRSDLVCGAAAIAANETMTLPPISAKIRATIAHAPDWLKQDLLSKDATVRERAEETLAARIAAALSEGAG